MNKPIALLTDFGLRDPYVGVMKGVIIGINPSATIVDVCHEIAPGDIPEAAFCLASALPYFPEETIFAAVVDPSVGTKRRAVAAGIGGRTVICPDNGILTWAIRDHGLDRAVEITDSRFFLPNVSDTFHGRDVFAPVAANLSKGAALTDLGPEINDLAAIEIPEVATSDRSIQGEIIYVDRFGNLVSNISRSLAEEWLKSGVSVRVHVGSGEIHGLSRAYADVPKGHPVALFGSMDLLEIAVNGGSAVEMFAVPVGSRVLVHQLPE